MRPMQVLQDSSIPMPAVGRARSLDAEWGGSHRQVQDIAVLGAACAALPGQFFCAQARHSSHL